MSDLSFSERVAGGIWGLLVGDAIGVPYEFKMPDRIPSFDEINMEPPKGYDRSHPGVPIGTWSDDGSHALCLLASLLYRNALDVEDLMRRLTNWYELGYLSADGKVFDVGVQTSAALGEFRSGRPAIACGSTDQYANGNGSLMRVLPLALWHRGSDADLVEDAQKQSRITHGHIRAQVCCALYCLWARRILFDRPEPWLDATATLRQLYPEGSKYQAELEFHIRPDDEIDGTGSGYVVDCLRSARQVLREGSYGRVIRSAIRLGRDTDTTASVAGGLAGVRDGVRGIPERWLEALRGREVVEPMIEKLQGQFS